MIMKHRYCGKNDGTDRVLFAVFYRVNDRKTVVLAKIIHEYFASKRHKKLSKCEKTS